MNLKKKFFGLLAIGAIVLSPFAVWALPGDWSYWCRNEDDTETTMRGSPSATSSTYAVFGKRYEAGQGNCASSWYFFAAPYFTIQTAPSPLGNNNYQISFNPGNIPIMDLTGATEAFAAKASTSSVNTLSSTVSSLSSSVSGLSSNVTSINSLITEINQNLYGTSTSMNVSNASTTSGLMSKADKNKLNNLATVATTGSYNDLNDRPTIPNVQATSTVTNSSGVVTWTFPTAFSATPKISVSPIDNTSGVRIDHKVTAVSTSSVSIQMNRAQVTNLLGVDLLSTLPAAATVVHITAVG